MRVTFGDVCCIGCRVGSDKARHNVAKAKRRQGREEDIVVIETNILNDQRLIVLQTGFLLVIRNWTQQRVQDLPNYPTQSYIKRSYSTLSLRMKIYLRVYQVLNQDVCHVCQDWI